MKISFDTDGTKTYFYQFLTSKSSRKYLKKKYNMEIVKPKALELEDIYDIKNTLLKRGYTEEEANKKTKEIIKKYWVSYRFIQFSLLDRFRKGVRKQIVGYKKQGHEVNIDTSRGKTTDDDLIGKIAKNFTLWQYKLNGVFLSRENIAFYKNDEEKIAGIKEKGTKLLFDDKPAVIEEASKFTKVICVNNPHNIDNEFSNNVARIDKYTEVEVEAAMKLLFGEKNYQYILRDAESEKVYRVLKKLIIPVVLNKFKPIILNEQNIIQTNEGVIYAPNHRSTLDPIIITSVLYESIHWVALKRFFTGEDSIFNNNKKYIFCKITSAAFNKMEYFPIERIKDNPNANNLNSLKDMNGFLRIGSKIGIFPEGTTLKQPFTKDFGEFDSSFIKMAKKNNTWIQPITTLWTKELEIPEQLIINFGKPFKVGDMSIQEAMNLYLNIQESNMEQMKQLKNTLNLRKVYKKVKK